jgi:hypothetical protein
MVRQKRRCASRPVAVYGSHADKELSILPSLIEVVSYKDKAALHKKSGSDTRSGSSVLNKPSLLVVACNFCAKPPQVGVIHRDEAFPKGDRKMVTLGLRSTFSFVYGLFFCDR